MRRALRGLLTIGLAATAALAGGCWGSPLQMPAGFVAVGRGDLGGFDARGVSADGVALGLRTENNPRGGTLEFWSQAIENEMTAGRGYRLMSAHDVTGLAGARGKLLTFSVTRQGAAFTYAVAVFVDDAKVTVAEAGGKEEPYKKHAQAVREALLSVR